MLELRVRCSGEIHRIYLDPEKSRIYLADHNEQAERALKELTGQKPRCLELKDKLIDWLGNSFKIDDAPSYIANALGVSLRNAKKIRQFMLTAYKKSWSRRKFENLDRSKPIIRYILTAEKIFSHIYGRPVDVQIYERTPAAIRLFRHKASTWTVEIQHEYRKLPPLLIRGAEGLYVVGREKKFISNAQLKQGQFIQCLYVEEGEENGGVSSKVQRAATQNPDRSKEVQGYHAGPRLRGESSRCSNGSETQVPQDQGVR